MRTREPASGPNGINRKVPVGQVADEITNFAPAQLQHVKTLQGMRSRKPRRAVATAGSLFGEGAGTMMGMPGLGTAVGPAGSVRSTMNLTRSARYKALLTVHRALTHAQVAA